MGEKFIEQEDEEVNEWVNEWRLWLLILGDTDSSHNSYTGPDREILGPPKNLEILAPSTPHLLLFQT